MDINSTFINIDEFAEEMMINGNSVNVVIDGESLKKYNLKSDAEGLARGELLFYAPVSSFLEEPFIDGTIEVNNRPCTIIDLKEDEGMYEIILVGYRS